MMGAKSSDATRVASAQTDEPAKLGSLLPRTRKQMIALAQAAHRNQQNREASK